MDKKPILDKLKKHPWYSGLSTVAILAALAFGWWKTSDKTPTDKAPTTTKTPSDATTGPIAEAPPTAEVVPLVQLCLHGKYSNGELKPAGISNNCAAVHSGMIMSGSGDYPDIEDWFAVTPDEVENKIRNYFASRGWDTNTSNLFTLSSENPVHVKDWAQFNDDALMQKKLFRAMKMRIDTAKKVLPNARLSLHGVNTGYYNWTPEDDIDNRNSVIAYRRAAAAGVFDSLDYTSPSLYLRFGPGEANYQLAEAALRSAIEINQTFRKSDGSRLGVCPSLSLIIYGSGPHRGEYVPAGMLANQINWASSYKSVGAIKLWMGYLRPSDTPYMQEVVELLK